MVEVDWLLLVLSVHAPCAFVGMGVHHTGTHTCAYKARYMHAHARVVLRPPTPHRHISHINTQTKQATHKGSWCKSVGVNQKNSMETPPTSWSPTCNPLYRLCHADAPKGSTSTWACAPRPCVTMPFSLPRSLFHTRRLQSTPLMLPNPAKEGRVPSGGAAALPAGPRYLSVWGEMHLPPGA